MKKLFPFFILASLAVSAVFISCLSSSAKNQSSQVEEEQMNIENSLPLPVIRINSIANGGNNDFVTEPVAKHVKEAQASWFDFSNKGKRDPWYEDCNITVENQAGEKTLDAALAQVKVRGNWTTNYAKKSFRIKFDKKQAMLGLNQNGKYKNWVLLACWKDASLLRDGAALKMYKAMFPDYYVSDCALVEVYINDSYWGVYLLAEQQETKEGRIQITEAEKNYNGTDIGYLIEFDNYYYTEAENERFEINYQGKIKDYYGSTISNKFLQKGYTIKSDVYDPAQKNFIQDYMNKLWKICYEAAYNKTYYEFDAANNLKAFTPSGADDNEKCKNCISKIIDIKSLADMYIFNEIICDPDLYLTSFFMDIDFGPDGDRLLRFEAPWDFDSTMGNKRHCADGKGLYAGKVGYDVNYEELGAANPWMLIFINCDWFRELVKAEWQKAKAGQPQKAAFDFIDQAANYSGSFVNNRDRWGNPGEDWELYPLSAIAAKKSQAAAAKYFKDWLEVRFAAVDKLFID